MASEFHKKAISNITPEERALMVKSLEIISQIHSILDEKDITQKELAEMLNVSPAAVSKMLIPGGNLELNTIIKLELLLKETIITTPRTMNEFFEDGEENWTSVRTRKKNNSHLRVAYKQSNDTPTILIGATVIYNQKYGN